MLATPTDPLQLAVQALAMRRRLEASRPRLHLKRGFGGVADIEFIVQYLQLVHAARLPTLLRPNLWDALDALKHHRLIDPETHEELRDAYGFLRAVEGRLRLIQNRNVGSLPELPDELERLARRLNDDAPARSVVSFLADVKRATHRTRAIFDRIITTQAQEASSGCKGVSAGPADDAGIEAMRGSIHRC